MYKVKVYVTLRENILDVQGTAVKNSLHTLHYNEVEDIRVGKYMELTIQKSDRAVEDVVREICEKMLANTVMEDFRFEVEEVVAQ